MSCGSEFDLVFDGPTDRSVLDIATHVIERRRSKVRSRNVLSEALDRLEDLAFAGDPTFERLNALPLASYQRLPEALIDRLIELERAYWPRAAQRLMAEAWDLLRQPSWLPIERFVRQLLRIEEAEESARAVGLERLFDKEELHALRALGDSLAEAHQTADERHADDLERQLWRLRALVESQIGLYGKTQRTCPGMAKAFASTIERISVELDGKGDRARRFRAEAELLLEIAGRHGMKGWLRLNRSTTAFAPVLPAARAG